MKDHPTDVSIWLCEMFSCREVKKKEKKEYGSRIKAFDSDSRETHGNWKRSEQNAWVVPKGRAIMPISEQLWSAVIFHP